MKHVAVKDLYVQCSYPLREPAVAMSDCCRQSATSAVEDPYGVNFYYRCNKHEGLFRDNQRGRVVFSVPVSDTLNEGR